MGTDEDKELADFHRAVQQDNEFVAGLEAELARTPEMGMLVHAYGACPPRMRKAALDDIARFTVRYMARRMLEHAKRQSHTGS